MMHAKHENTPSTPARKHAKHVKYASTPFSRLCIFNVSKNCLVKAVFSYQVRFYGIFLDG